MTELDVRSLPPRERHSTIHEAFAELDPGETLTIVNDHEPNPLYHEFKAEVETFDEDGYTVDAVAEDEYVATFPKRRSE